MTHLFIFEREDKLDEIKGLLEEHDRRVTRRVVSIDVKTNKIIESINEISKKCDNTITKLVELKELVKLLIEKVNDISDKCDTIISYSSEISKMNVNIMNNIDNLQLHIDEKFNEVNKKLDKIYERLKMK